MPNVAMAKVPMAQLFAVFNGVVLRVNFMGLELD
jgi:hypothetical protein